MAKIKQKREDTPESTTKWMVTFSDLISLMLTFFILLVSMSTLDQTGLSDISTYFQRAVSIMHPGEKTEIIVLKKNQIQKAITPQELILAMRQKSNAILKNSKLHHKIKARMDGDNLIFRMEDAALFKDNEYKLSPKTKSSLYKFGQIISEAPGNVKVEGHTSKIKNSTPKDIKERWDLSLKRAISVAQVLYSAGVSPSRIKVSGYGDSKPISSKDTENARKLNHRVDIIVYDTH